MIDYERLQELEADFGPDALVEIIDAFLDETDDAIAALRATGSNPDARRGWLHFIKGSARTIGASGLGDLCARLESQPGFGPDDHASLEREFAATRRTLGRKNSQQSS